MNTDAFRELIRADAKDRDLNLFCEVLGMGIGVTTLLASPERG